MNSYLIKAFDEYEQAVEAHADAEQRARAAICTETDARNRLNQAQKKIDGMIAEMRKAAPDASDWRRDQRVVHAVRDMAGA